MVTRNVSRRRFLKTAGLAGAALAGGGLLSRLESMAAAAEAGTGEKPNILLINVDDLGWKDLSCMGSTYYHTPNIDRLAKQGMLFTNHYASAPVCAPSRACMMSGQYSPRHGLYSVWVTNPPPRNEHKVVTPKNRKFAPGIVTIAETLDDAGYANAHVGKWHIGDEGTGPKAQGFDVNVAGSTAGMPKTYFSPYKMKYLKNGPKGEYLPDRLTDEAIDFMRGGRNRPFFVNMAYYTVHCLAAGRLEAKQETIDRYKGKKGEGRQCNPTYAAMVEIMDRNVGRLLDELDRLGVADKTLVVFTSDNGGWGPGTDSAPLRGQKGMLYEGGIRVPLIVRWPGKVKPGAVCDEPVINIDFYPTFCEALGLEPPRNQPLDGVSLLPLLTGKAETLGRDAIFWHFPAYTKRWPDNTTLDTPFITRPVGVIRMGDWKLMEFFEEGRLELYNLREDPGETKNLASERPEKLRELHERMKKWRKDTNAAVPSEPNPGYAPKG